MLDAACPGEVFTSPVPDQMLAATKAVDGGAGVLHIVKNYTGDVMNFKLAAELAEDEGIQVESVLTNDDVAVEDSLYTAGRRGVGVTVLLEKIAGAKAEAGGSLAEVAAVARQGERARAQLRRRADVVRDAGGRARRRSRSAPTRWSSASASTASQAGGARRSRPAAEIVAEMAEAILSDLAPAPGARLLAFVNGLGGTPLIELYVVYNELAKQLADRGLDGDAAAWSATTSRASRWRGPRSRCSSSTTS